MNTKRDKKDIFKHIRYNLAGLISHDKNDPNIKNSENDEKSHEMFLLEISDKMRSIVTFLKNNMKELDINIIEASKELDNIEHVETRYFILVMSRENDMEVLHIQLRADLDIIVAARIGLLLSCFYTEEIIDGFSFLDPYVIVKTKDDKLQYLYGEEAKEAITNINFDNVYMRHIQKNMSVGYLQNLDIEDMSMC